MTELVVRRLLVDLESPIAGRWNGGDAFSSAFFNALSMSFPVGEQYFIDSVRAGMQLLPEAEQARYAAEVQGFIGQEATHRRVHFLFNGHLEKLGYSNEIERRSWKRLKANAHLDARTHVGATAATEHFTAIFADWMLRHPEVLEGAEPRLQALWLWHSAEESEHCSTAFDIYQAISGHHGWRIRIFRYITFVFLTDVLRQTVRNLWHDGSLFRWATWRSGAHLLFAKDGIVRGNYRLWRDYFSPGFHPRQHDTALSRQWLRDNSARFFVSGNAPAQAA
ncbi:MAG: metal-dependent hydrolase [Pseudomonadota bacterium]